MVAFGYASGTRTRGQTAITAAYIARVGAYEGHEHASTATAQVARNGDGPGDLVAVGVGNMPPWVADDPIRFWAAADRYEREKGRTANTRILTLPRGVDGDQKRAIAHQAAAVLCGERHPFLWAIHEPPAMDGAPQPHIHLMWSPRILDGIERGPEKFFKRYNPTHPERGGARKATQVSIALCMRAAAMMAEREAFADIVNAALASAGLSARVDPRSNAARGMLREPEPKLRRDQRGNPAALSALRMLRARWAEAEEAGAEAAAVERIQSARVPPTRLSEDRRHTILARRMRAEAASEAKEADLVERAGEAAEGRILAARRPAPLSADRHTATARHLRAEAIAGAREQHVFKRAQPVAAPEATPPQQPLTPSSPVPERQRPAVRVPPPLPAVKTPAAPLSVAVLPAGDPSGLGATARSTWSGISAWLRGAAATIGTGAGQWIEEAIDRVTETGGEMLDTVQQAGADALKAERARRRARQKAREKETAAAPLEQPVPPSSQPPVTRPAAKMSPPPQSAGRVIQNPRDTARQAAINQLRAPAAASPADALLAAAAQRAAAIASARGMPPPAPPGLPRPGGTIPTVRPAPAQPPTPPPQPDTPTQPLPTPPPAPAPPPPPRRRRDSGWDR